MLSDPDKIKPGQKKTFVEPAVICPPMPGRGSIKSYASPRYRRSSQRRQVHPLQRVDFGRRARRQLSIRHHRAEHRRGDRAGRAAGRLAKVVSPQRTVPATVEFLDIAGLVKGASQAKASATSSRQHPRSGRHRPRHPLLRGLQRPARDGVDPVRDREIIAIELALADLSSVERRLDKAQKAAKLGDAQSKLEVRLLEGFKALSPTANPRASSR